MARAKDTKQKIEQAAISLFADKGFDGTSIKDIAQRVGVSEAALYRHFPNKERMGLDIYISNYSKMASVLNSSASSDLTSYERVRQLINVFCNYFHTNPDLFRFLLLSQHRFLERITDGKENVVDVVTSVLEQCIKKNDLQIKDPEQAAAILMGIVLQTAVFCLYGRLTKDIRALEKTLLTTVSNALQLKESDQ